MASPQSLADIKSAWLDKTNNLRLAFDLSARGIYNVKSNHISNIDSLGFDLHKVFTSKKGDIATLVAQGYLTQLVDVEIFPAFYKNNNDLKFICRICNINFVVLSKGNLNLRIGHYEIPFGLEHNIDTNGTLRQYSNGLDLGGKLDWGVTANGKFSWGGYEISLSRGAGVDWTDDYKTYIVSGRVEKTFSYESFLGFSAYHGHQNKPHTSRYTDRTRFGLDASTQIGPVTLLSEVSIGKNSNTETINSLIELDIHNNSENLLGYFQFKTNSQHLDQPSWNSIYQATLGIKYSPNNYWAISSQWTHDIEHYVPEKQASVLSVQLRVRY